MASERGLYPQATDPVQGCGWQEGTQAPPYLWCQSPPGPHPSQKADQPASQGAQTTPQTPAGGGGPGGSRSTWKCRMIVQMRPRVSLGLPSAMSSFLMFTSFTCERGALGHGPQGRAGLVRVGWGPGPGRQPYLAVPEVVQGNLDVLQLVETHSPLLPGLWGGSVSTHSAAAAPRPHPQQPQALQRPSQGSSLGRAAPLIPGSPPRTGKGRPLAQGPGQAQQGSGSPAIQAEGRKEGVGGDNSQEASCGGQWH